MIFKVGLTTIATVQLRSAEPTFESGIEWREVGGVYKPLYRGSFASHYSSDIEVTASRSVINSLWTSLTARSENSNGLFTITPQSYERLMGPEFIDSFGHTYTVDPASVSYPVDTGDGLDNASISMTIKAANTITSYIAYSSDASLFSSLPMKINRTRNGIFNSSDYENGKYLIGFNQATPTCEIEYTGTRQEIGQLKATVESTAINTVSLNLGSNFIFDVGTTSANAYILNMVDMGPLDAAGTRYGLVVTFGKA